MKKYLLISIATLFLLQCFITGKPAYANDEIKVSINGVLQKYDQPPVIVNDRTLVPLRGIFEALGANVAWDDASSTVTASKGNTTIKLTIGEKKAYVNGAEKVLDQESILVNSRTMVPVRFVSEALGCTVNWEEKTQTIIILPEKQKTQEQPKNTTPVNSNTNTNAVTDSGQGVNENFNNASAGSMPIGWIKSETGGKVSVEDLQSASDGKVLRLQKVNAEELLSAGTSFQKLQGGIAIIEFNILFDNIQMIKQIAVKNDDGDIIQRVGFNNGVITAGQPGGLVNLEKAYKANTWYKIRIEINLDQKQTDIYINDEKKADAIKMMVDSDNVSGIDFVMQPSSTGNMYIDFLKANKQ